MPPQNQNQQPESGKQKTERIDRKSSRKIIFTAGLIDLSQVILEWLLIGFLLNPLIDAGMFWFLPRWFKKRGVDFNGTKRIIFIIIGMFEFVPVVAELPLWILDVILILGMVKLEDRTGLTGGQIAEDPKKALQAKMMLQRRMALVQRQNATNQNQPQQNTDKPKA